MMKKILRICRRQEKGDVIVIFALSLVTLLAFVSLAIDIGMVNMKRAAMMDLCQQMRKARLEARDYIMHAEYPAEMIYEISNQCARENGFRGALKVYYREETDPIMPTTNWVDRRKYDVRIELKQEYQFAFAAAIFTGPGSQEITVYLDGGEQKTSGVGSVEVGEEVPVWFPGKFNTRTGSYKRKDSDLDGSEAHDHFLEGDWPANWVD